VRYSVIAVSGVVVDRGYIQALLAMEAKLHRLPTPTGAEHEGEA
jgi:hypothetical protein